MEAMAIGIPHIFGVEPPHCLRTHNNTHDAHVQAQAGGRAWTDPLTFLSIEKDGQHGHFKDLRANQGQSRGRYQANPAAHAKRL